MTTPTRITTLFLDIGGVLLTNGWDRSMRRLAADRFGLDHEDMNERHHLTFDTYEQGKLTLDSYLDRVVFCRKRSFSREEFKTFMFGLSEPLSPMIELVKQLRKRYGLTVLAVSKEGRELMLHRINTFALAEFIDFFVCSCFVHFRKPDVDIFRIALDLSQAQKDEIIYVDDRALFVEVARSLGVRSIHHTGVDTTRSLLASAGLAPA